MTATATDPRLGEGSDPAVLLERRGGVLVLTLNRPDKLNAWNAAIDTAFRAAMADAAEDPEVRAVVVTGAGRGFCSGADMSELGDIADGGAPERTDEPRVPATLRDKPVVVAVNGIAAGMGLAQVLWADVRFASPDARFLTAFSRRGLVAEYGTSWLLQRLVGTSRAADLLLSSRMVGAAEAHRIGLVDHLVEDGDVREAAIAYAADLATWCSPTSMRLIKQQLRDDAERGLDDAVLDADRMMHASFRAPDLLEGVRAYAERRPPEFPGIPGTSAGAPTPTKET
ncbi:MAG: enoyl-CoA hydratase [Nocardioides sp.]|nr:enoyl-CoA hydratase [Nocardioides sp.]